MKSLMKPFFLITLLTLWSIQAAAATLTEKDVRNVISIMGEIDAISAELNRLVPELEQREAAREEEMHQKMLAGEGASVAFPDMKKEMQEDMEIARKNPQAASMIDKKVRQHGFKDVDEWIDKSVRVMKAHMAIMTEQAQPDLDAMMEQLKNTPDLPKEVVDQMLAQQQQMIEGQKRFLSDVTPADKQAVAPLVEEINQAFNYYDDDEED